MQGPNLIVGVSFKEIKKENILTNVLFWKCALLNESTGRGVCGERGSKGEERWEVNGKERRGGRGVVCFLHVLSVWTLHQMKVVI